MPGDPWGAANANVAVKYDAQQNAIQRMIDSAKAGTISSEQAIQGFGNQGRDIIGQTYGTLYGLLGNSKTQTAADLGGQVNLTQQGYDNAISAIGQNQQNSRSYLEQMAKQLGQEGAGFRNSTELENIVNTQLGRAQSARATYGGNLADWAARMGGIQQMGIDSAHSGEALRRTEFESQLLKQLGENRLAGTTEETDLTNKMTDLLGNRQNDLINMYNQLAQQEWENAFAQAQLDQQAADAAAQRASAYEIAAMQESGANSRAAGAKDDSLDWAKFAYMQTKDEKDQAEAARQFDLQYGKGEPVDIGQAVEMFKSGALGGTYDFMGNFQPNDEAKQKLNNLILNGRPALASALQGPSPQSQVFNPNFQGPVGPQYAANLQRTATGYKGAPSAYDQWKAQDFTGRVKMFNQLGWNSFKGGIGAAASWL